MSLESDRRNPFVVQALAVIPGYKDSAEAAARKVVRDMIRKAGFSRSEREVILAVVNLWFYHKNGLKGYIHPGRKLLAKRADVSIRTVATTLGKLRDAGVLQAIANRKGEGQKPTHYTVDLIALFEACGHEFPKELEGNLVPVFSGTNCTPLYSEIAHHWRAEIAHSNNNAQTFPGQRLKLIDCTTDGGAL